MQQKKKCTKCKKEKSSNEYYKDKRHKSGLYSACKECANFMSIKWQRKHPQEIRETKRKYAKEHREQILKIKKKYSNKKNNKEKIRARHAIRYAVKVGKFVKLDRCEICNSKKRIQAHHPNYKRKLKVKWLCAPCHYKEHRKYKFIT